MNFQKWELFFWLTWTCPSRHLGQVHGSPGSMLFFTQDFWTYHEIFSCRIIQLVQNLSDNERQVCGEHRLVFSKMRDNFIGLHAVCYHTTDICKGEQELAIKGYHG